MITPVPLCDHAQMAADLETNLLADLATINVQSSNDAIAFRARNEAGHVVGGITAQTSYGWLLIKILWVDKRARGNGLGRQLVLAAEHSGRSCGCHSVWLDTSNLGAHRFYQSLGYTEFGRLENALGQTPSDHKRWFMKKAL